jgi:preprotein translocase subunit SecD
MSIVLSIVSTLAVAATVVATAMTTPIETPPATQAAVPDVQLRFAESDPKPGLTRFEDATGRVLYLWPETVLSTIDIASAMARTDPVSATPVVELTLTAAGRNRLARATTDNVGRILAVLVDEALITAPVIREPILGGRVRISGRMTMAQANDLALLLRAAPASSGRSLADAVLRRFD